jgi:hypothetical protein
VGEAWQCPRCSQVNAPWVPRCSCRATRSGSPHFPGVGPLGQKLPDAYKEAYRVDDKAYKAYTLPHTPAECPCCRVRSEAWEKLRAEFERIETEADLAEGNPARKEEHDPEECPGCQAYRAEYRKMEEEREAARKLQEQGLPFMPYPTDEPNSKENDTPEDDAQTSFNLGQTYFDLGMLQERGEVAEVAPSSEGEGISSEERAEIGEAVRGRPGPGLATCPYCGEECNLDRHACGPVGFSVETVRGKGGKRYPWKAWVASGCPVLHHVSKDDPEAGAVCQVDGKLFHRRGGGTKEPDPIGIGFMPGTDPDPVPGGTLLGGDANERPLSDEERAEEVAERLARRHVVGGAGQPTAPGEDELQDEEDRPHMVAPRHHDPVDPLLGGEPSAPVPLVIESGGDYGQAVHLRYHGDDCEYRLRVPGGACTCMKQCSKCGSWSNSFGPGGHECSPVPEDRQESRDGCLLRYGHSCSSCSCATCRPSPDWVAPRYHGPECEYHLRFPGGACTCMKQCSKCGAWWNQFGPGGHECASVPEDRSAYLKDIVEQSREHIKMIRDCLLHLKGDALQRAIDAVYVLQKLHSECHLTDGRGGGALFG